MDARDQLNEYLSGDALVRKLTVLPPHKEATTVPDRLVALMDIYKIFLPRRSTMDIYNRLYLSLLGALEKKETIEETRLLNENYLVGKGLKRYGIIGGYESFRISGTAGIGKSSSVQRCIDLISGGRTIKTDRPYREIIPFLTVECVADGSFKALLYAIMQAVDSRIGTTFFASNNKQTTTVDQLLSATANILINHVAVLVIDEVERMANDSRKGETLLNYITQLVNQSNIAVCFVGNVSSNRYFERKEYLSRRTVGMTIHKMNYDEYFYGFCKVLFSYQYVENKVQLDGKTARLLFRLSNGIPSLLVGLFVEAQRNVIVSGRETLDEEVFNETFENNFSTMKPYVELNETAHSQISKTDSVAIKKRSNVNSPDVFVKASQMSRKDTDSMIEALKNCVAIEYVNL